MGVVSEVATTFAENALPSKKLRLKILTKKPASEACELSQVGEKSLKSSLGTEHVIGTCQLSKQVPKVNCSVKSSVTQNRLTTATGTKKLNFVTGCKRRSEEMLESNEGKRLNMDRLATLHCQNILDKLMCHKLSYPFHVPVDTVAWGIPDYFDIVKNPMDLGTIKQKLQQKIYIDAEEFAVDVRLTFSNAMLYNPAGNWVHKSAKELNRVFDKLWKPNETKLDREQKYIKPRGSQHLKKLSIEDDKPKDSLSSNIHSDFSGPVSCLHNKERACPMSAKVKCENASGTKVSHDHINVLNVKHTSISQVDAYGQDKEHVFASFSGTSGSSGATANKGLDSVFDIELSPSKALRVARLKSRFADTILKAQHNSLLEPGGGKEASILQQEKQILQRRQHEEKARLEAQIRDVESAAQFELKRQRQEAREAARTAIQKMERSVDHDDNLQVLKDLEAMVGSSLVVVCNNRRPPANVWSRIEIDKLRSPLEQLGLYIKEEYMVGNDDDYAFPEEDQEEGEFIC